MPDAFRSFRQAPVADAVFATCTVYVDAPSQAGDSYEHHITPRSGIERSRDEHTPQRTNLGPNSIFSDCTYPGP